MSEYTSITIIYNPNSTGSGKKLAADLKKTLASVVPKHNVELLQTEHAGHGETLAYDLAIASKRALVISASGDGGYHDVVNGLMRAQAEGAKPVAGILPAGNANDHFKNLHRGDFADAIAGGKHQVIDLLKLTTTIDGQQYTRFAHSYIGIGLTPQAGRELNKTSLNRLKEAWIITRVLLTVTAVHIKVRGKVRTYDSLIFSNIGDMSKILSLSNISEANDGKFEITAFRRRNRLKLIATLFKATTTGIKGDRQATTYSFTTIHPTLVQLDGEIRTIDAGAKATITIEPRLLSCIV